jgi:uncharacterized membrane protein
MARSETEYKVPQIDENALPFVAPSRVLALGDPVTWFRRGWQDFKNAPATSLCYGGFLVLLSYVLTAFTWKAGGYILMFSLMSGFVFIAPVLAIGLYSVSCQLERGLKPRIGYCLMEGRRHLGNEMVYSMILLVIFMVWARAGSAVHIFFPMEADPEFAQLAIFLAVGSAIGLVFSLLVFSASAFSLPMMLDRKVDTVTAVLTSVHAVMKNKGAMVVWVSIIVASVAIGFATAFLGLAVLMPVIGYATWHGYRDTIQARDWPENSKLPE